MELLLRNLIKKRNTEMKKRIELTEDLDESIKDVFGRLVLSQVQNGVKLSLNDRGHRLNRHRRWIARWQTPQRYSSERAQMQSTN